MEASETISEPIIDDSANAGTGSNADAGSNVDIDTLREQILKALENVHDPELEIDIVNLGLVYGVDIDGDAVHITYSLTTMGCPIGPMIEAEMRQNLAGIPGVGIVTAELVLRPAWTPEMMSEEAKAALGFF